MTEAEWRLARSPIRPLDWVFFNTPVSDRKLRLFSIACCRRVRLLIQDTSVLRLLDLSEAFAEGQAELAALRSAHQNEQEKHHRLLAGELGSSAEAVASGRAAIYASGDVARDRDRRRYHREQVMPDCLQVVWQILEAVAPRRRAGAHALRRNELGYQAQVLHDVLGPLPFRDVAVPPAWLTSDVLALARGIYDEKAFDRMPILADALQDAGCDNDEVLLHCRQANWEHVRGCWVIDLLLGRPWREVSSTTG